MPEKLTYEEFIAGKKKVQAGMLFVAILIFLTVTIATEGDVLSALVTAAFLIGLPMYGLMKALDKQYEQGLLYKKGT
ncbi:MAG: hypothetical protein ACTSPG_07365 [Candidatus Hodarchaeales archaeon]